MIISKWEIKYPNATQVKNLISHKDYLDIIKPLQEEIKTTQYLADKETDATEKNLLETVVKLQKHKLNEYTGGEHWFTNQSPLYLAFNTGILKLNHAEIKFEFREIIES